MWAAAENHAEVVTLLLTRGADRQRALEGADVSRRIGSASRAC